MRLALIAILVLLIAFPSGATELVGRVVRVIDGDTLEVLTIDHSPLRIRLAEIDAPEHGQPYGSRAKQALSGMTFGQTVSVAVIDHDVYGRTVGRVHCGKLDVNAALVQNGAAWVYRRYSHDPSLVDFEKEARAARRGLWALPKAEIMPPWEWRRHHAALHKANR